MNILKKTQNFKTKILPLISPESDIIYSPECVTIFNGEKEIVISFIFDAYYLYDAWVLLSYYNFEIPDGTNNKEEIIKFINDNYCTIDEFCDYFCDIYDATWEKEST